MAEAAKRRRADKSICSAPASVPTDSTDDPRIGRNQPGKANPHDALSARTQNAPGPVSQEYLEGRLSPSTSSLAILDKKIFPSDPSIPATAKDKRSWKGFCEVESEPAFFNAMLKDFGVKGVKVQEVVSLDDEILALLPTPVYGLIFLYKWREEGDDEQVETCPNNVWFANQTIKDACASIALLNIVNNVSDIELGPYLHSFKEFTTDFDPTMRGEAIASFDFVKTIHNSFARKMDMLNADLQLKDDATSSKKRRKNAEPSEQGEAGFHFIAYVPVRDQLWKLDGLQRQPQNLGGVENRSWMGKAKPEIEARMAQYEEGQIEFAILSLVKDPLTGRVDALAGNVKTIVALETRLDEVQPNWRNFMTTTTAGGDIPIDKVLTKSDPTYGLYQAMIDQAAYLPSVAAPFKNDDAQELIACRAEIAIEQVTIRMAIKEEQQSRQADIERAESRRHDHAPLVKKLLEFLNEKGALEPLLA